jgi:phenylalanyl-tRNA synthetase beta chain
MYTQVPPAASYAASSLSKSAATSAEGGPWREGYEYFIQAAKNPTFFPGRCADVMLKRTVLVGGEEEAKVTRLGTFGILHPEVLHAFDIGEYPASALEVDLEPLM